MRVEATQNAPKPKERDTVKKVAVEFLTKLDANNLLVGHWREMAATQVQLPLEIENHLWANDLSDMGYSEADIANKVRAVFIHLFSATNADAMRVLH